MFFCRIKAYSFNLFLIFNDHKYFGLFVFSNEKKKINGEHEKTDFLRVGLKKVRPVYNLLTFPGIMSKNKVSLTSFRFIFLFFLTLCPGHSLGVLARPNFFGFPLIFKSTCEGNFA